MQKIQTGAEVQAKPARCCLLPCYYVPYVLQLRMYVECMLGNAVDGEICGALRGCRPAGRQASVCGSAWPDAYVGFHLKLSAISPFCFMFF